MAITKIHAIKATIDKSVDYICNPHKTNDELLISFFGTTPRTADFDFRSTLSKTYSSDPNLAYHLIQSFAPGEVTHEEAHRIGIELADQLLAGKYSYILTTHIDHDHYHNHLIFCAADNVDYNKYHDCNETYRHIRKLSDQICKEHGLSTIIPGHAKGKSYKEWFEFQKGLSWKEKLKLDIDSCISVSKNYSDFCTLIKQKGYILKGESTEVNADKYIAFKSPKSKNYIRGSERSLGSEYTRENIIKRIKNKVIITNIDEDITNQSIKNTLIDTTAERIANSTGLLKWAELQNLKSFASAYANAGSLSELETKISQCSDSIKETRSSIVTLQKKLKEAGEILKYAEQYSSNKKYTIKMKTSRDPDRYFREHDMQLTLFTGAENYLTRKGINPNKVDLDYMRNAYRKLELQLNECQTKYKTDEQKLNSLLSDKANISAFLSKDNKELTPENTQEPNRPKKNKEQQL